MSSARLMMHPNVLGRLLAVMMLWWNSAVTIMADEPTAAEGGASPPDAAVTDTAPATIASQDSPTPPLPAKISTTGRRIAIVLCGHPGDSDHVALFQSAAEKIRTGLTMHYEFRPENVHVFSGEDADTAEEADGDLSNDPSPSEPLAAISEGTPITAGKPATKEVIAAQLQTLKEQLTAEDSLFVIVIGHTYFESNLAWYNLHGPDIHQKEFAELFQGMKAREQVFFVTIPCSGFYIRTLSGTGRFVISATESDLEINETLCPHVLAEMLSNSAKTEWDLDADRQLSLFEFYIALCRGVADRYVDESLISTEHALLDDNADGKGSELQLHYLTEDQGGLPKNRQRPDLIQGRDGKAASQLRFTSF